MLLLEAAVERILSHIAPLPPETVDLKAAGGRWLANDVFASTDLPPFDNSAMDGYSVRAADVTGATPDRPVTLRCTGETPAGKSPGQPVGAGECRRVFTGAPLPPGADAVVMQEDVRVDPDSSGRIKVLDAARPWDHVRFRGEDIKRDARLIQSGERINFAKLAALAAVGCGEVVVSRRPRAALLATGDELAEPGSSLNTGQIFESNRVMLQALAEEVGCETKIYPVVGDDLERTSEVLKDAFANCDMVITSGGVSVGAHDYVKPAFESLGGTLELWKVAIRPGKPFAFGRLDSKLFCGLPGNPVSAAVTFLLLVRPALIRLQGGTNIDLPKSRGRLAAPIANPGARRHFVRAKIDEAGNVEPVGLQGSHVLSGLAGAHGLIDLAAGLTLEAGFSVEVLLFP